MIYTKKSLAKLGIVTALALSPLAAVNITGGSAFAAVSEPLLLIENFDSLSNGSLPAGWKIAEGKAQVIDGKLVLSSPSISQPTRVIVPLDSDTGDYVFEADMTFVSAASATRWASLMYRVQNEDYPYYQFAIRKGTNALNGLEFAERTSANGWNVKETNFYPEPFEYNKTYKIKVIASKNRVQQYINNKLVIDTDQAADWLKGDIGFQANGSTVQFDNVKLTKQTQELPPVQDSAVLFPAEPETNIINPPTLISGNESSASRFLQVDPNSNGELTVNGQSLQTALNAVKNKQIPVLKIENEGLNEQLIDALEATQTTDIHIVSSNPAIVKSITEAYPTARGGLIYTKASLNKHDLEQLSFDVHSSNGKTAIIPQKLLTKDVVHYLHSRMVSVWGQGADSKDAAHALIHLGVDGILSDNPDYTAEALGEYPENTIVQRPIVAAHRGVPSLAPENTMAGYRLAYELGADMIETDIQRTKDGHLIIMHDNSVNRTTNGTGNVHDLTLEEIRQLDAGIKYSQDFAGEKVPTFKEFLQEFKGKDVVLLVELKDTGIEEQVIQEIEEENMANQVVLQSFYLDSMVISNKLKPEIPVGFLYSAGVPKTESAKLYNARIMTEYGTENRVTLNASYGSTYKEFFTYMRQRGMLSMHWTFRAQDPFSDKLNEGLIGPITDYTQWLTESPISLETPIKKRNLKVGHSANIQAKAFVDYRTQKTDNIESELFLTEQSDVVQIDGNTIKALKPGVAQVFIKHTFTMLGQEWNIVSEPIEVTVSE
ncbi:DUF1080 domain-containing protein [Mesobacillus subterraneus]|uniref:glycerophosphodiester phosphodiesterase family protein n=1 Tax=Mesobacillus subterraneus TaxID=285983 RepID=UPI00203B771D|nr:glycerophosphodiester phosphodiesterase family protein [Mesobacillus subterraneus]MCM3576247.1 DUF1080 domain-containing protein [Mesobacillus subterraneus]